MAQSFIDLAVRRIDQSNLGFFQSKRFVVSSVPLHEKRLRYRGFNQSALLGSLLSKRMGLEYEELVVRKRHIRPLAELRVSLTKEERKEICERYVSTVQREEAEKKLLQKKKMDARRKATKGIFELKDRSYSLAQKNFLIVDDVWTSGATLLECGKVLKRREVQQVWGWAFSRSSGV